MEMTDDVHYLLHTGAKYRTKITGGHLPRPSLLQQDVVSVIFQKMIDSNVWLLEKNAVVMVGKKNGFLFAGLLHNQPKLRAAMVGNCFIIFDSSNKKIATVMAKYSLQKPQLNKISFSQFLDKYPQHYWLLSVCDEGSEGLSEEVKNYFYQKESLIPNLKYRESYVGIFKNGSVLFEQKNELQTIFDTTLIDAEYKKKHILSMASVSGTGPKSVSSIMIDGKELSLNLRGMNVVILDQKFNVVTTKNFDTFLSSFAQE